MLSFLPGVRELRAPLAAGYLWLLAGWVAFGDRLSAPTQVEKLVDQFAPVGQAAALTFAAYVVGSLLTDIIAKGWDYALRRERTWRLKRQANEVRTTLEPKRMEVQRELQHLNSMSDNDRYSMKGTEREVKTRDSHRRYEYQRQRSDALVDINEAAAIPISTGGAERLLRTVLPESDSQPGGSGDHLLRVKHERIVGTAKQLDTARLLMMSEQPALYNSVDRLRGEAEFRLALVVPLFSLTIVLVASDSSWWSLLLLPVLALAWLGRSKLQQSGDEIVEALVAAKVEVPAQRGSSEADQAASEADQQTAERRAHEYREQRDRGSA